MKISIYSILLCAALLSVSINCESLAHLNFDNVPEEGAVYQLGSMSFNGYLNGPRNFNSKGSCCCGSGSGSCTFSTTSGSCLGASGVCRCC